MPPWDVVVQLCRRICLLRHTGREAEAGQLHDHEFARAISALPPTADLDPRVQALFVAEEKRVLEAQALAEIIGPLIVEQLRSAFTFAPVAAAQSQSYAHTLHSAPAHSVQAASVAAPEPSTAATPSTSRRPTPTPRPVRTTAPSIADFIDDMLAQERPTRRAS